MSYRIAPAAVAAAPVRGRAHRLAGTTVHVHDDSPHLTAALTGAGLTTRALAGVTGLAGLDPATSVVVVRDDGRRPGLRLGEANAACHAAGLTWLPIGAFDGAHLRLGPLVVPGSTACTDCLRTRLPSPVDDPGRNEVLHSAGAPVTPPLLLHWVAAFASLVVLRWVALRDQRLPGRLYTLVLDEPDVRAATVLPVPRCKTCGADGGAGDGSVAAPAGPGGSAVRGPRATRRTRPPGGEPPIR